MTFRTAHRIKGLSSMLLQGATEVFLFQSLMTLWIIFFERFWKFFWGDPFSSIFCYLFEYFYENEWNLQLSNEFVNDSKYNYQWFDSRNIGQHFHVHVISDPLFWWSGCYLFSYLHIYMESCVSWDLWDSGLNIYML